MEILQNLISDDNLAWKKSLDEHTDSFLIKLSHDSILELDKKKDNLQSSKINDFPILEYEILKLKESYLIQGNGFFILDGSCLENFSNENVKEIFRIISTCFGQLYVQNIKNEKFVTITDEGKSMKTGGRYHQTKEGGSFHTDSPQWSKVPDFVGLLCIRPAKIGGISKFVSAYTIHNQILKLNPDFLKLLYKKFHFDKRNEFQKNESPTTFEPIFKYEDNELKFRYLRNYIDDGQKIVKQPLSSEQNHVLDQLDNAIHDENFSVSYDLSQYDMTFFNNHRIIHGRTSFEDYMESDKKRYMVRVWIKNNR
jgi:alpha-ketoglutarate-dependent taurine dioxygenase|tara:strand:- start:701 stop:1630 length:930 start_codon:yes stop_codon:yes gene_type:complete